MTQVHIQPLSRKLQSIFMIQVSLAFDEPVTGKIVTLRRNGPTSHYAYSSSYEIAEIKLYETENLLFLGASILEASTPNGPTKTAENLITNLS